MSEDNGAAPASQQETPPAAGVPVSERVMGAFGLAVALAIALIGFDLLSGGVLSRALARPEAAGDDG